MEFLLSRPFFPLKVRRVAHVRLLVGVGFVAAVLGIYGYVNSQSSSPSGTSISQVQFTALRIGERIGKVRTLLGMPASTGYTSAVWPLPADTYWYYNMPTCNLCVQLDFENGALNSKND